jgi:hypothetical protein
VLEITDRLIRICLPKEKQGLDWRNNLLLYG